MGVLSLAGGTYPSFGCTYLGHRGTLLGWGYLPLLGVPTLARGLPTFVRGYLPWLGSTYLGQGVPILAPGGTYLFGGVLMHPFEY